VSEYLVLTPSLSFINSSYSAIHLYVALKGKKKTLVALVCVPPFIDYLFIVFNFLVPLF